jgi:dipeptidase D
MSTHQPLSGSLCRPENSASLENEKPLEKDSEKMSLAIKGLLPQRLWENFEAICSIPRGSKNEEKAALYILDKAKKLGLTATRDGFGNVLVCKDAGSGRENAPIIALQSHLDMVCEKNSATRHDFLKDPITLIRKGSRLYADGTTLGADNGIGVATCLAMMEEISLKHGRLEFLFTLDEETGLNGALNLRPDFLKARTLINLDSDDEGVLHVGCAGGGDTRGTLKPAWETMPLGYTPAALKIRGLQGGHSGVEIHSGRGNAIKLLTRAILALAPLKVRLVSISGGNKRNAIPREADAVVAVPAAAVATLKKTVGDIDALYKNEYGAIDAGVSLCAELLKTKKTNVMKPGFQKKLLNLLYAMPHGVLSMSAEIEGLVETSANLAIVKTSTHEIVIETSQRSSVESKKKDAIQMVTSLMELAGAKVLHDDGYPGWKPNLGSPILKTARRVYTQLFKKEVAVKAVHAGLECGIIGGKYPGIDMISMGPTLKMIHSPDEYIEIESVKKYWDFLCALLAQA